MEEKEVLEDKKYFESEIVYDGFHKIEKIIRKSEDKEVSGEIIKKKNSVAGLIYNSEMKKYIFIERYRLAANGITIESLQDEIEEGEKPEQTMKRLVTEKTGYKVNDIKFLTSYYMDSNNSEEVCYLYFIDVGEKLIDDLTFDDYKLLEVEKLGLGGKLFLKDPLNLMNVDVSKDKEEKVIPPYQCIDAKTLTAVMWVENNNVLREMAETITNAKIRSL